jgi:SAM-dependent methyltransferase
VTRVVSRLTRPIHGAFRNPRLTDAGEIFEPKGARRLATRFNQALAENGFTAPWYMTHAQALAFWAARSNSPEDANAPNAYAAKDVGIVDFLHEFWRAQVAFDNSVLEVGSNAGANLERLRQLGYTNLGGVEINPVAIETMQRAFPLLSAPVTRGAFEDVLATQQPVDAIFTMGVLMHVHPSARGVFRQIARLARVVCTIELETAATSYIFPRNYGRVFARLGCRELRRTRITRKTSGVDSNYYGLVARLFETAWD